MPANGPKYGIMFITPANIPRNTENFIPRTVSNMEDKTAIIKASSSTPLTKSAKIFTISFIRFDRVERLCLFLTISLATRFIFLVK